MSQRQLPARASLENLRKQAKALHRAFRDGDAAAIDRIRHHLPRAASLSNEDLGRFDLSLQEAQHVLAKEYGHATWEDLKGGVETPFEDLARLSDRDTQMLMREVTQPDLTRALIGASEAVRGRFLSNMSRRVRTVVVEDGQRLAPGLPDHEPAASRQRVLEWAEALGGERIIAWPPPAGNTPWFGPLEQPETVRRESPDPLGGRDLEELGIDELARILGELATRAQREGIASLCEVVDAPGLLGEGLRLAVEWRDPGLVESMLKTRTGTVVRNRRLRLTMMRHGVEALVAGTHPKIIWHDLQAHYLDSDLWETPRRLHEEIGGAELRDWIEREWLTTRTPAGIAELFLHLGHAARNEGGQTLAGAAQVIEPPLLRQALVEVVADHGRWPAVRARFEEQSKVQIADLEARLRAVTAGVLGVMAGRDAAQVGEEVRAAAAAA